MYHAVHDSLFMNFVTEIEQTKNVIYEDNTACVAFTGAHPLIL